MMSQINKNAIEWNLGPGNAEASMGILYMVVLLNLSILDFMAYVDEDQEFTSTKMSEYSQRDQISRLGPTNKQISKWRGEGEREERKEESS